MAMLGVECGVCVIQHEPNFYYKFKCLQPGISSQNPAAAAAVRTACVWMTAGDGAMQRDGDT